MRNARADSSKARARASRGVSTCIAVRLAQHDSGSGLDGADPADEQAATVELGLERGGALARDRDEEAAGRLRVVRERLERERDAVRLDRGLRELAVATVAARALALPGDL